MIHAFRLLLTLSLSLLLHRETIHAQWQDISGHDGGIVSALAVSGSNLFAGTYGGGAFLSSNNGTSWTPVDAGLPNPYVSSLAVSGTNLFAGTDLGVFLSTNSGACWT